MGFRVKTLIFWVFTKKSDFKPNKAGLFDSSFLKYVEREEMLTSSVIS